eukprot:11961660-Alexandrium_andersonii.AAC.1
MEPGEPVLARPAVTPVARGQYTRGHQSGLDGSLTRVHRASARACASAGSQTLNAHLGPAQACTVPACPRTP